MLAKHFAIFATTAMVSVSANAEMFKKFEPQIEVGGKLGNERNIGAVKMMVPVYQKSDRMVFTDIRGRIDDEDTEEFNLGLGYRQKVKLGRNSAVLGAYGFYDQLSSATDNDYSQVTLGLEALTKNYEARVNYYIPEDDENPVGQNGLIVNGGSIGIRNNLERALGGFDAEVGYKLPVSGYDIRAYVGGYHFSEEGFDDVTGPSGRIELNLNKENISLLPSGSELTLGVEAQTDDVRDEQIFAIAEFRMPLNFSGGESKNARLKGINKQMIRFIERDVDIVTSNNTGGGQLEAITIDGIAVNSVTTVTGNTIVADVTGAGQNSLVVVDGTGGTILAGGVINMQENQIIAGGGTTITAVGVNSGASHSTTLAGAAPTIDAAAGTGINTANNTFVRNLDFTNTNRIATISGDSSVKIDGLSHSAGTPAVGIEISGSNGTIDLDNLDFDNGTGSIIVSGGTTNALSLDNSVLDGNIVGGATDHTFDVQAGATITTLSGSGNTLTNANGGNNCEIAGTVTGGSFAYNATNCP